MARPKLKNCTLFLAPSNKRRLENVQGLFFFDKFGEKMRLPRKNALEVVRKWQKRAKSRRGTVKRLAEQLKRPEATVRYWAKRLALLGRKSVEKEKINRCSTLQRTAAKAHRALQVSYSYRTVCRETKSSRGKQRAVRKRKRTLNRVRPEELGLYDTNRSNSSQRSFNISQRYWS